MYLSMLADRRDTQTTSADTPTSLNAPQRTHTACHTFTAKRHSSSHRHRSTMVLARLARLTLAQDLISQRRMAMHNRPPLTLDHLSSPCRAWFQVNR